MIRHVIYYCQIQLGLAEHFTAAKQHEQRENVHVRMPRAPLIFLGLRDYR